MKKESELRNQKSASSQPKSRPSPPGGFAAPLSLRRASDGLKLERFFTAAGADPFDTIEW